MTMRVEFRVDSDQQTNDLYIPDVREPSQPLLYSDHLSSSSSLAMVRVKLNEKEIFLLRRSYRPSPDQLLRKQHNRFAC